MMKSIRRDDNLSIVQVQEYQKTIHESEVKTKVKRNGLLQHKINCIIRAKEAINQHTSGF
jgi:hypothetical protein